MSECYQAYFQRRLFMNIEVACPIKPIDKLYLESFVLMMIAPNFLVRSMKGVQGRGRRRRKRRRKRRNRKRRRRKRRRRNKRRDIKEMKA